VLDLGETTYASHLPSGENAKSMQRQDAFEPGAIVNVRDARAVVQPHHRALARYRARAEFADRRFP